MSACFEIFGSTVSQGFIGMRRGFCPDASSLGGSRSSQAGRAPVASEWRMTPRQETSKPPEPKQTQESCSPLWTERMIKLAAEVTRAAMAATTELRASFLAFSKLDLRSGMIRPK